MYISITGLESQSPWKLLIFYSHAIPCLLEAKDCEGNVSVEVKSINGVKHTLSVWQSEQHMQAFIDSNEHKKEILAFNKIAEGKTLGFESTEVPDWNKVHHMWVEHDVDYSKGMTH